MIRSFIKFILIFSAAMPAYAIPTLPDKLGSVKKGELIQRVTLSGTVTPARKTIITAPYSGYVRKVYVKIGDSVKAGQPIVSVAQSLQALDNNFPVRAPYAGTVVQVEKSEGEFVKQDDAKDYLVRIDDMSTLFVVANAPELDRSNLQKGQEAQIRASAILDRSYKGVIKEMALAARESGNSWERTQVEFPIRIEVINPDPSLIPGMSVLIDVITQKREGVLILGHEYIQKEDNKYFATLKKGKRVPIQVGLQNEEAFEIKSGLKEGDQIQQVDFTQL